MIHNKNLERFEQMNGTYIEKLYWIAGSIDNSSLKELLDDFSFDDFKKIFSGLTKSEYNDYWKNNELSQLFIDYDKLGLFAKIHIPICDKFKYNNDNNPVSWSVNNGHCRIEYVYAETLEELINKIEKISEKLFQKFIKNDLKKNKERV
jgi:hypothetical protein